MKLRRNVEFVFFFVVHKNKIKYPDYKRKADV